MAKQTRKSVSGKRTQEAKSHGLNVPVFMVVTVSVILLALGITFLINPSHSQLNVLGEKTKRIIKNDKPNTSKGSKIKNKGVGDGVGGGKVNNRGNESNKGKLQTIKAILQDELKGDDTFFNDKFESNIVSSDTNDLTNLSNAAPITE